LEHCKSSICAISCHGSDESVAVNRKAQIFDAQGVARPGLRVYVYAKWMGDNGYGHPKRRGEAAINASDQLRCTQIRINYTISSSLS